MSGENYTEENGWLFPPGVEPPENNWYRYPIGDTTVHDFKWEEHVHLAHQAGLDGIDVEIVDSGEDNQGIRYAVSRVEVTVEGDTFAAIGSADETSNQVRDPEYTWSVAESRGICRAVKKALDIRPSNPKNAPEGAPSGNVAREEPESDHPDHPDNRAREAVGYDGDVEW